MSPRRLPVILFLLGVTFASASRANEPWPAESVSLATNETYVEGAEPNDFHSDMSGSVWNPATGTLWVCRNGPGGDQSKFWALVRNAGGEFEVAYRDGRRGEWTGFGDLESIAQASWSEDVVYLLIEGEETIKEYDVAVYGTAVLRRSWNLRSYLPLSGGSGAEALTFVPDAALAAGGFVDRNGQPYTSRNGMGGLMFVGHQNGGALFVFDLNRTTGAADFVGEYRTGAGETAGAEFDRSTGYLYLWHDAEYDTLEKLRLSSTPVAGQSHRRLDTVAMFDGPDHRNNEGLALMPVGECRNGSRGLVMTIDGGGPSSLLWYTHFTEGCAAAAHVDDLALRPDGGPTRLWWSDPSDSVTHDVVRGRVEVLLASQGDFAKATERCLENDLGADTALDSAVPAPAQAYWYLVRPSGGSYDAGDRGQVGMRDPEIAASPAACP